MIMKSLVHTYHQGLTIEKYYNCKENIKICKKIIKTTTKFL